MFEHYQPNEALNPTRPNDAFKTISADAWSEKNIRHLQASEMKSSQVSTYLDFAADIYGSTEVIAIGPIRVKDTAVRTPAQQTIEYKELIANKNEQQSGYKTLEWISKITTDAKDYASKFHKDGHYHGVSDVAGTVVNGFRSMLQNLDRNKGEYEFAVGIHDGKLSSSSEFFTPSTGKVNGYELHPALGSAEVRSHRDTVVALIHTHPNEKDADPFHFSLADKFQADMLQAQHPEVKVRAFLLTPNPKNQILVYDPNDKAHPDGEEIGHFDSRGNLVIANERYRKEFEKYASA